MTRCRTKAQLEALENTPEDLKVLDERNASVLKAVQFSVFCEELFQTLMHEALRNTSNWTDTAYNISNYASKKLRADNASSNADDGSISVLQVLDDEIQLRVNEKYHLSVKLVDVSTLESSEAAVEAPSAAASEAPATESTDTGAEVKVEANHVSNGGLHAAAAAAQSRTARKSSPAITEEAFLSETCRYSLLLLEQEIRHRHGRKDISRALLYTGSDMSTSAGMSTMGSSGHPSEAEKVDATTGTLATVLVVLAHNLLKEEVTRYLDDVSATLALQKLQVSASGRVLEDGLLQPICDSVRGVYVSPRWKVCPYDSTLSAFDLSIGKNFTTGTRSHRSSLLTRDEAFDSSVLITVCMCVCATPEVLITGTRIRFEDGPASVREVSGLDGLREFVEKTVCTQVALALHRDALSFGLKQATMDLDRASVRLFSAKEWNGTCIGDGRVSDTKAVGSIYFEPYFEDDGSIAISCMMQAVDTSSLASYDVLTKTSSGSDVHSVDWKRIPGQSDAGKLAWLLQKTGILLEVLTPHSSSKAAAASSASASGAATATSNGTSG